MVITYYADMIFAWNFVLDYMLIVLIHPERKKKHFRIGLASVIGALFSLAILYWWRGNIPIFYILRFLCAALMSVVAIQAKGLGEILCNSFLLYGTGGSLYGVYALLNSFGIGLYHCTAIALCVSLCLLFGMKRFMGFRRKANAHTSYHMEVCLKNNDIQIKKKAFYDSGNHLYEPISGKPVILIRSDVMKRLGVRPETFRLVPYSSIGNDAGMLSAYKLDELLVCQKNSRVLYKDVYAAVAQETLFLQEDCDVILHSGYIGLN